MFLPLQIKLPYDIVFDCKRTEPNCLISVKDYNYQRIIIAQRTKEYSCSGEKRTKLFELAWLTKSYEI